MEDSIVTADTTIEELQLKLKKEGGEKNELFAVTINFFSKKYTTVGEVLILG
jgi:hypothetical protein